jgi:hypothetical protein
MDEEGHHVRQFGSKTLTIVPENHVGGSYRIGKHNDEGEDGEFVLFGTCCAQWLPLPSARLAPVLCCVQDLGGMSSQRRTTATRKWSS